MKTSELKKGALDWAVAQAAGITVYPSKQGKDWLSKRWMTADYGEFNHRHGTPWWNPSWNWSQGGLIIQREGISLEYDGLGTWVAWLHHEDKEYGGVMRSEGQDTTPLKAAMRCYVTSKLGNEIELPEGLNGQV